MGKKIDFIRQSARQGITSLFYEIQVVRVDAHTTGFKLIKFLLLFLGFLIFGIVAVTHVYNKLDSLKHIEYGRATTAIKAKGIGFDYHALNQSTSGRLKKLGDRYVQKVFDSADFVVPQTENNAIFIITRMLERENQTIDFCEENYLKVKESVCDINDNKCPNKDSARDNDWNGVPTGECKASIYNESVSVCQVLAWCPVERYDDDSNIIYNVRNYTLFIKNHVDFPEFNIIYNNLVVDITDQFLKLCAFDKTQDPHCPVFTVDYILNFMYPNNLTAQNELLYNGAFVEIKIDWYCPFHTEDYCWPTYYFKHVDRDINTISSGFNTRDADYYEVNGVLYRNIYKVYGLRFIVNVQAKMWRWGLNETATYVGTWSMIIASIAGILYAIAEFIFVQYKFSDAKQPLLEEK